MSSGLDLYLHSPYTTDQKNKYLEKCLPLYISALTGDWKTAEKVIDDDPDVVYASITEEEDTVLHIAAVGKNIEFVKKLIPKMKILGKMNGAGNTALCFAAGEGNLQIVELMINAKSTDRELLPTLCGGPDGVKPIYKAASSGHREIVNYLYPSDFVSWPIEERATILTACVANGLFDVALKMINQDNKLLITKDENNDTTLDVLVRMSSEFDDDNEKPKCLSSCKNLLESILSIWLHTNEIEISILMSKCPVLVLEAARLGNTEFLVILLRQFPHQIWTTDNHKRNIFHFAVLNKHIGIFNLIYEVDSIRSTLARKIDEDGNNMLHLAAKSAPPNELDRESGAALQMQREILWFKEVTKIVPASYRNMKNKNGETPQDIFTREHAILMGKGERWMTGTANGSMMVSTIIISVVYSSVFVVPSMSNNPFMKLFYLSLTIAFSSCLTSILMFLCVLTSRFAQEDFLYSLPLKLVIGIMTLIFSLGAMVLAFCTAIFLSYHHGVHWIHFLLGVFSFVPLSWLVLKLHLLRDVICSTYNACNLFGPRKRLFYIVEK